MYALLMIILSFSNSRCSRCREARRLELPCQGSRESHARSRVLVEASRRGFQQEDLVLAQGRTDAHVRIRTTIELQCAASPHEAEEAVRIHLGIFREAYDNATGTLHIEPRRIVRRIYHIVLPASRRRNVEANAQRQVNGRIGNRTWTLLPSS